MTDSTLFTAPWDHKLALITATGAGLLLLATGLALWAALSIPSGPGRLLIQAGGVISLGALLSGALLAPRGYTIQNGHLTIDRALCPVTIPLESIAGAEILPAERLRGSFRTLGSGGLFGYYGRFRNAALGRYRMYATRGDGYVLVRGVESFVLTPDSPGRFIETLNRARGAAAGRG